MMAATTYLIVFICQLLRTHGPNTEPEVAAIGIDIPFTGIEVQKPSFR